MTERNDNLASFVEISPLKELMDKFKDSRCFRFPKEEGMLPEKAFCDKLRACSAVRFISSSGIGPSKWLDEKSKEVKAMRILTKFNCRPLLTIVTESS